MENKIYAASLLIEAAEALNESAASHQDQTKKKIKDIESDIKDNKFEQAKQKIEDFKKWYFTTKHPDQIEKNNLRQTLIIVDYVSTLLITMIASFIAEFTGSLITVNALFTHKVNGKLLKTCIISFSTILVLMLKELYRARQFDKYTAREIDDTISYCEKKITELKKAMSKMKSSDPGYAAVKKTLSTYSDTLEWAKSRKAHFVNKDELKNAKQNLKEVKKTKDSDKINESKKHVKDAKYNLKHNVSLSESVAELLIEAAELLNESSGKNGQALRLAKESNKINPDNPRAGRSEIKMTEEAKNKISNNIRDGKYKSDEELEIAKNHARSLGKDGKRFNHRKFSDLDKSQNESVAELLIEAAELLSDEEILTESIFKNKKKKKLSDQDLVIFTAWLSKYNKVIPWLGDSDADDAIESIKSSYASLKGNYKFIPKNVNHRRFLLVEKNDGESFSLYPLIGNKKDKNGNWKIHEYSNNLVGKVLMSEG